MSKCNSGHFKGTSGLKNSSLNNQLERDIISDRVKGLDLRQHPTKSLTSKQMSAIRKKVAQRTANAREYRFLRHSERFLKRRRAGVKRFWEQERERIVNNHKTTRKWSAEQIRSILHGHPPKYKGKTIAGHHTYSASKYPHLANRGEVIYPVTFHEHFTGWHGGDFRKSKPGKPIKKIKDF